jgi:hypothetical protein
MMSRMLPQSTPYDPAEDPPGSIDPLGTVTGAEQLAEVLLPGLTARMWRVRLLTFAALAAEVSKRVAAGREDQLIEARLAFERLFVSAIARQEDTETDWRKASRRLPGIGLARQALRAGDQPLARANFLKGQGVNGPFGVVFRLARDVGAVDEVGELERAGTELLLAWVVDQELPGLLDDETGRVGATWLRKLVKQVSSYLEDGKNWPAKHWPGWEDLASRLRPDRPGPRERQVITKLLSYDPLGIRDRVVHILADSEIVSIYRTSIAESDRRDVERAVITRGFSRAAADDDVGRTLHASIQLIDAYENLSGILESVFRGLLWSLTRNNGQAPRAAVVHDPTLRPFLGQAQAKLGPATQRFQSRLKAFESDPLAAKRHSVDIDRMHKLLDDANAASPSVDDCVSAVMDRHVRVQKEKNKGVWIEEDKKWTLMPGFGDTADEPLSYDWYLHPYRITNVYEMLADLGVVPEVKAIDGEESE